MTKQGKSLSFEKILVNIVVSGLEKNPEKIELLATTLSRKIKKDYPEGIL